MESFDATSLTPLERQIILQAISIDNDCRYCVAWHTAMLNRLGLGESEIAALRAKRPLSDARLEALRWFSVTVSQRRGHVSDMSCGFFLNQDGRRNRRWKSCWYWAQNAEQLRQLADARRGRSHGKIFIAGDNNA